MRPVIIPFSKETFKHEEDFFLREMLVRAASNLKHGLDHPDDLEQRARIAKSLLTRVLTELEKK